MNRSKSFPALVISFFLAFAVQVESKTCPNTIHLDGKKDFKTRSIEVYQECITEFEKTYGEARTFFENVKLYQVEESEYFQRVFAAIYYLNPKETIVKHDSMILHLSPINPNIFFKILVSSDFYENSNLTIKDIKNIDEYPVFSLILSIYKNEIDIYDALESSYFKMIPHDIRYILLLPIVSDQVSRDQLDPDLLRTFSTLEAPDEDYFITHDLVVTTNGMFYALNGNQYELGREIYESFEKTYFSIDENYDNLVSWGWDILILNKLALDSELENQSAKEIVSKRNNLIKAVQNNYKNWFWLADEESKQKEASYAITTIKSDIFLNLYDGGSCKLALEVFETLYDAYFEELILVEAGKETTYERSYPLFTHDDPFVEPVEAAICAIELGRIDDAKKFLDLSERSISHIKEYLSPMKIGLFQTTKLMLDLQIASLEESISAYNDLINKFNKESLFEVFSSGAYLNDLINNVFFIYNSLIALGAQEESLSDPMLFYNLKFQAREHAVLKELFLSYSKENLSKDQLLFLELNEKLEKLESELLTDFNPDTLQEIKDLSSKKNSLLESIYASNTTIKSLNNPIYPDLKTLKEKSFNNPILIPNMGSKDSFIVLIQNGDFRLFDVDINKTHYEVYLKEINESISKETSIDSLEYNYESAFRVYDSMFSDVLSQVAIDQSLIIYGSDLSGLPVWALPRNEPIDKDYVSNFLNANWLINDYSFAFLFPISQSASPNTNYKNNFIGFGNPQLSKEFGLPSLTSAEDEMIQLALYSGVSKDNVYLKQKATKEIFLTKLAEPTKRFAVGTHSVAFDPSNKIFQPSLLFSGEDSIITAADIVNTKISSELVLLTACNTIKDKNNHNFTLLPRSFLVAGSDSVIFSNWNIESISASEISKGIFKNLWLNNDLSIQESLRLSVKDALKNSDSIVYMHPKFWAGMSVAYGTI